MNILHKKTMVSVFGFLLSGCASVPYIDSNCHYKFRDQEIIERFNSDFSEVNLKEIGFFDVKKKNCNYYVKYTFDEKNIDASVIIYIFDKEGEIVSIDTSKL